jgi:threonine/homoserine efflux transporter RhtA
MLLRTIQTLPIIVTIIGESAMFTVIVFGLMISLLPILAAVLGMITVMTWVDFWEDRRQRRILKAWWATHR